MANTASATLPGALPDPIDGPSAYRRGILLVLLVAFLWSFSGLIFRGIEAAGPWQIIFYRSLGVILGTSLLVIWKHRAAAPRAVTAVGWDGLLAACCLAGASVCYFQALHDTTVANISFIQAAHPFIAALLAWLLLKERVSWRTLLAASLALAGVTLMVLEGLSGSGGLLGNVLALATSLFSAGYAVALRRGRRVDMTPAVTLSGIVALILTAPLAETFAISWRDLGLCLLQGMVISAFCNSVFAYAARSVPAAELTLFTLLETVLSPLWVWLIIAETPSAVTLLGGTVILCAVLGHALTSTRRLPRRAALP